MAIGSGNETGNANDIFARIQAGQIFATEEMRIDLAAADIYKGLNTDATATTTATWSVVRVYLDGSGNATRIRFRSNVAWDSRTSGWT